MMRIRLVAALGLAPLSPAFADGERWEFRVSNMLSPEQPTAHVELWAHFDRRDHAFGGTQLDVLASEPGWVDGSLFEMGHGHGIGTTPGVIVGSDVLGIIAGQIHFPPHWADTSNPILVWEADFTASAFTPRSLALETNTFRFDVYLSETTAASASRLERLTEGAGEIVVIPAPGALALGAGAMLMACLRKRRR